MLKRTLFLAGIAICLVTSPSVGASEVEVARDAEADFGSYETYGYRFKEGLHENNVLASETPIYREIVAATDRALARKGLERDDEEPDLWISFQGLMQESLTVEGGVREGMVGSVTWIGDPGAFSMQTVRTGTLIVEVFERASGEKVWSGWTSENAVGEKKVRKKAGKAASRIFKHFPRP